MPLSSYLQALLFSSHAFLNLIVRNAYNAFKSSIKNRDPKVQFRIIPLKFDLELYPLVQFRIVPP